MENFTPISAVFGGTLIGLSTVLLLLTNGRIAGISGITNGLLTTSGKDKAWRTSFLIGLIAGAGAYLTFFGMSFEIAQRELPLLLIAGFLVGFGTKMGNGCTSGHGVCGLARLSVRSLVATATFLIVAITTVWLTSQLGGA